MIPNKETFKYFIIWSEFQNLLTYKYISPENLQENFGGNNYS